jgi:hypothetical protein
LLVEGGAVQVVGASSRSPKVSARVGTQNQTAAAATARPTGMTSGVQGAKAQNRRPQRAAATALSRAVRGRLQLQGGQCRAVAATGAARQRPRRGRTCRWAGFRGAQDVANSGGQVTVGFAGGGVGGGGQGGRRLPTSRCRPTPAARAPLRRGAASRHPRSRLGLVSAEPAGGARGRASSASWRSNLVTGRSWIVRGSGRHGVGRLSSHPGLIRRPRPTRSGWCRPRPGRAAVPG